MDKKIEADIRVYKNPNCCYCPQKADGAMLTVGYRVAHADCVIRKLNELLDPDYDGKGEPAQVVGYLAGYVKLADDQNLPEIPLFLYDKEEDRELLKRGAINYSKMLSKWRKVIMRVENGS